MTRSLQHRYSIGEASEQTGVAIHLLRQWEEKFPQLHPSRDRAGRRFYLEKDLEIVRRIRYLLHHEKMTAKGARIRLAQELHGEGRPRTRREAIDILDRMEEEIRSVMDILDTLPSGGRPAG